MSQPRRRRNVAKLLARLNPKSMRVGPTPGNSRGGVPDETALDIAGALGYVSAQGPGPRLAAVVLCLRWWPGLVEGPMQVVGYREIRKTDVVRGEKRIRVERLSVEAPAETDAFRLVADLLAHRQYRKVEVAYERCDLQERLKRAACLAAHARLREAPEVAVLKQAAADADAAYRDAERDLNAVNRAMDTQFRQDWARVVIQEYRHPNHCQTCTPWGRAGEVPRPVEEGGRIRRVEWQTCPTCFGAGVLAWSAKRRAKALRIGEHPWRNLLNPIHEGALSLLRELEWRAARALVRRLGG